MAPFHPTAIACETKLYIKLLVILLKMKNLRNLTIISKNGGDRGYTWPDALDLLSEEQNSAYTKLPNLRNIALLNDFEDARAHDISVSQCLDVFRCAPIETFYAENIKEIGYKRNHIVLSGQSGLKSLNLKQADFSNEVLDDIVKYCPGLENMTFEQSERHSTFSPEMFGKSLITIASSLRELTFHRLQACCTVSAEGEPPLPLHSEFTTIGSLRRLGNLQSCQLPPIFYWDPKPQVVWSCSLERRCPIYGSYGPNIFKLMRRVRALSDVYQHH